jgi:hypothetical protein
MKQMTKEGAKATIAGIMASHGRGSTCYSDAAALIASLQALGLWTPTEPKSVEDEVVEALTSKCGWSRESAAFMINGLNIVGFTVTKAVK